MDGRFTKIVASILADVRDLAEWGIEGEHTTQEQLRLAVLKHDPKARAMAATKMIEAGLNLHQVAKVLDVPDSTLRSQMKTIRENREKESRESRTGSAATKAKRAAVAAKTSSKGVTKASGKKYRIIYADPPWDYGAHAQPDYHTEQRDHYAVMTIEQICAEPVREWIEDDAILFLWVTSPILEKSFQVVRAWGFEYKATFIWDKIKHNMGHYNSVRHEILLICTKGACQPDKKELFDSVQSIERSKHSAKPPEFFDIIETLYTHGRRLEMYGRRKRDGWDAYGHVAELEAAE